MAKSTRKKRKSKILKQDKPLRLPTKGQTTPVEYVGYLLELHKLQGVLLNRLDKIVR